MNQLEKIVNCIRIAPHGIIPATLGAGLLADIVFGSGLYENLQSNLQVLDAGVAVFFMSGSIPYALKGIKKYHRFKDIIQRYGIVETHVKLNLVWYCDRQAYRAAAFSCGFGREFDEINDSYPKQNKRYRWVPRI